MILAEILHELEYALLEGNEKKVSSLLDAFGQESTQSGWNGGLMFNSSELPCTR